MIPPVWAIIGDGRVAEVSFFNRRRRSAWPGGKVGLELVANAGCRCLRFLHQPNTPSKREVQMSISVP